MSGQIAGSFITSVGGMIMFAPFQGNTTPEFSGNGSSGPPALPYTGPGGYLDAANWRLNITTFLDDTTHTGSYGAQSMDRAAEGFTMSAEIIVQQTSPPDMLAKYGVFYQKGNTVPSSSVSQYGFNLGTRMLLIQGAGVNYPADNQAVDFWYAPSCKVEMDEPVIDANNKKMVRMAVRVRGNSRIFKLPAEAVLFTDYVTHLQNRGQVF